MSYATELQKVARVPQYLVELDMIHCDNHYGVNAKPNQLLRSGDLTHAAWTVLNGLIVTGGQADPKGGTTAFKLEDANAGGISLINQVSQLAASGKTGNFSVWLRSDSPQVMTLSLNDSLDAVGKTSVIKIGTAWTRYDLTFTFGAATGNMKCYIRPTDLTASLVGVIYAWGPQLTETSFPLTYETTAAAVVDTSLCTAAVLGDGSRCCYSSPTCQDLAHFKVTSDGPLPGIRRFRFCMKDAPLPIGGSDVLPFLMEIQHSAQAIDPKRAITTNDRYVLTFYDEALNRIFDQDKLPGSVNTSTQGTFWRRFRAIYRNYPNRTIRIKQAFASGAVAESEFVTLWEGKVTDFSINEAGQCQVTALDKLQGAKRQIPAKISDGNVLVADVNAGVSTLPIKDANEVTDPTKYSPDFLDFISGGLTLPRMCVEFGYDTVKELSGVCVFTNDSTQVLGIGTKFLSEVATGDFIWSAQDDEVYAEQVQAVASDTGLTLYRPYNGTTATWRGTTKQSEFMFLLGRDTATDQLTVQRHRYTSVTSRAFPAGTKFREVFWLASNLLTDPQPVQMLDAVKMVLQRCNVADADIDSAGIAIQRDLWHSGSDQVLAYALIRDAVEGEDVLFDMGAFGVFNTFVDENQKVTVEVFGPPQPGQTILTLDDESNFSRGSISFSDQDEDGRVTRVVAAWDKFGDRSGDQPNDYHRVVAAVNADSESSIGFGDEKQRNILSKYAFRGGYNAGVAAAGRTLTRFLNGAQILVAELELKDIALKLGDLFFASTRKVQTVTGGRDLKTFQVIKKQRIGMGKFRITGLVAFGSHRVAFIGPNSLPSSYDSATAVQKQYGWIGDANNLVGTGKEYGYVAF